MILKINKITTNIANFLFYIAVISLGLLLILNSIEIFIRYFLKSSNLWSQEVSLLLVSYIVFLGFAKVVVEHEDISITFVRDKFSGKAKLAFDKVSHSLLFITSSLMLFYTVRLMIIQKGQTTIIANIPNFLYILPLAIVLVVIILYSFGLFFTKKGES